MELKIFMGHQFRRLKIPVDLNFHHLPRNSPFFSDIKVYVSLSHEKRKDPGCMLTWELSLGRGTHIPHWMPFRLHGPTLFVVSFQFHFLS